MAGERDVGCRAPPRHVTAEVQRHYWAIGIAEKRVAVARPLRLVTPRRGRWRYPGFRWAQTVPSTPPHTAAGRSAGRVLAPTVPRPEPGRGSIFTRTDPTLLVKVTKHWSDSAPNAGADRPTHSRQRVEGRYSFAVSSPHDASARAAATARHLTRRLLRCCRGLERLDCVLERDQREVGHRTTISIGSLAKPRV